jgi:hypothetical protein
MEAACRLILPSHFSPPSSLIVLPPQDRLDFGEKTAFVLDPFLFHIEHDGLIDLLEVHFMIKRIFLMVWGREVTAAFDGRFRWAAFSGRVSMVQEVDFSCRSFQVLQTHISRKLKQLQTVFFINDSTHLPCKYLHLLAAGQVFINLKDGNPVLD